ncbi:hypothetical protein ACFX2B_029705 [Malus domestica]
MKPHQTTTLAIGILPCSEHSKQQRAATTSPTRPRPRPPLQDLSFYPARIISHELHTSGSLTPLLLRLSPRSCQQLQRPPSND